MVPASVTPSPAHYRRCYRSYVYVGTCLTLVHKERAQRADQAPTAAFIEADIEMASLARSAYPRFAQALTAEVLESHFTPRPNEVDFVEDLAANSAGSRLGALTLVKCFQYLGYFPDMPQVPQVVVQRMRSALCLSADVECRHLRYATLSRHRSALRSFLKAKACGAKGREVARAAMQRVPGEAGDLVALIDAGVAALRRKRIELPAFATIVGMARRVQAARNRRAAEFGLNPREAGQVLSLAMSDRARVLEIARRKVEEVDVRLRELAESRRRLERKRARLLDLLRDDDRKPALESIAEAILLPNQAPEPSRKRRPRERTASNP